MPKKRIDEAQSELERAHEVRLAYLSRNHNFRRDVQGLAAMYASLPGERGEITPERTMALGPVIDKARELEKEWSVPFDVLIQLSSPQWRPAGPPYQGYPAAALRPGSAVIAWTTLPPLLGTDAPKPTAEENRYLNVRVDLNHPVETLLPLIEKELRRFAKNVRGGRRRLNEADFYLAVFDLAESGESYEAIAAQLRRPVSTVKSGYLTASRHIFGPKGGVRKKAVPLASFNAEGHCQTCPICSKAQTPEELCPKARLYAYQGQKGDLKPTGLDTVGKDIARQSATGEPIAPPDTVLED